MSPTTRGSSLWVTGEPGWVLLLPGSSWTWSPKSRTLRPFLWALIAGANYWSFSNSLCLFPLDLDRDAALIFFLYLYHGGCVHWLFFCWGAAARRKKPRFLMTPGASNLKFNPISSSSSFFLFSCSFFPAGRISPPPETLWRFHLCRAPAPHAPAWGHQLQVCCVWRNQDLPSL